MSFANLRERHKYKQQHVHTLMLMPPGVDLREALVQFRQEMKSLEAGVKVRMYPDGKETIVKGALAYVNADHVQACINCGHMGNNAFMNCRYCLVHKSNRLNVEFPVLEWQHTRTEAQGIEFIRQMKVTMGPAPSEHKKQQIRLHYGIREREWPLYGLLDAFRQGLICLGHLIDLGLLSRLIDEMIAKVLSNGTLEILESRLNSFEYPPGWCRLTSKIILLKGRKMKPMGIALQIGLMAPHLFQGLVDPRLLLLVSSLLHLRREILNPHHSNDTIARTQKIGKEWITAACCYSAQHRTLVMDLPNTHLLLELLLRILPMVRNVRAGMTNRYESQHQIPKHLEVRVKQNVGSVPENFALTQISFSEGIKHVARGGLWGNSLEFKMGPALAAMMARGQSGLFKIPKWIGLSAHEPLPRVCAYELGAGLWACGWLVVGGWWLVVGGWWLVVGGSWFLVLIVECG
jgi:hypothetical protein